MKFLFDNNLAPKMARGLNAFVSPAHQVIPWKDQFAAEADDSFWMARLTPEERWIIVTADSRIGSNPHEIEAWKQAGHTVFFLKPGWLKMPFWEQAQRLVECFPKIIKQAERAERGSAFFVRPNGKIEG
jgi:hypothetical protein